VQTTSGQARGLHGDAGGSNAHGSRFGCALEQPAAWSWCLCVVLVSHDAVFLPEASASPPCEGHSEFNLHSAVSSCFTISSCVAIPYCVGMSLYGASLLVLVASATPADRMHTATDLGARSSNQQRGRSVYASCLWPTIQYWGFLEGARDFKARSAATEHTNKVRSGGRDPSVSRPGDGLGRSPTRSFFFDIAHQEVFLCYAEVGQWGCTEPPLYNKPHSHGPDSVCFFFFFCSNGGT